MRGGCGRAPGAAAPLTTASSSRLSSPPAGIGLPMLLATAKNQTPYAIGKPTLIVWLAYAALLVPLAITLVWVWLEKWRMTHRLGRFLCAWCVAAARRSRCAPPPLRTAARRCSRLPPTPLSRRLPLSFRRFFAFIVLVCALGFSGVSAGDVVVVN